MGGHARAKSKTRRQTEKEQRYRDLLETAGRLFGTYGYASVALDDIGNEVGVSGQAIYRHFKGKQDMLGRLLVEISAQLLEGGQQICASSAEVHDQIAQLIDFHVDFALASPEIIRVQEREMPQLLEADRDAVRRMQRQYLDIWSAAIGKLHPAISSVELRTRIHGVFGLINSTAHSMKHAYQRLPASQEVTESAPILAAMAQAAIDCRVPVHDSGQPPPLPQSNPTP